MFSEFPSYYPPFKRRRRTATSVCAGDFDPRPHRDVLTSVLNGVPPNPEAEARGMEDDRIKPGYYNPQPRPVEAPVVEQQPQKKKRGRPPKVRSPQIASDATPVPFSAPVISSAPSAEQKPRKPALDPQIYGARPIVHLPSRQRSLSVTPPPMPSSPPTTPGPSISSNTSFVSSKRPHTPDDDVPLFSMLSPTLPPSVPRPRKKRPQTRKGWKGWVEVSDDEEDTSKLISSDAPVVISLERKTRSGGVF
jgi:hypothetical protein